jgi:hypothetical protein
MQDKVIPFASIIIRISCRSHVRVIKSDHNMWLLSVVNIIRWSFFILVVQTLCFSKQVSRDSRTQCRYREY